MDWVIQDLGLELVVQFDFARGVQLTHLALSTAKLSPDGGISNSNSQCLLGGIGRVADH